MFCPLKFNAQTTNTAGVIQPGQCQCEETECAWWDENYDKCAVALAGNALKEGLTSLGYSYREAHGLPE